MDVDDVDKENLIFVESSQVKEGVMCDVYKFKDDTLRDLGIIRVKKGYLTPLQKVLKGKKTIEIFKSGVGSLSILRKSGQEEVYDFPGDHDSIEINVGDTMQWKAEEDLVFHEICYPPYGEDRFENITT